MNPTTETNTSKKVYLIIGVVIVLAFIVWAIIASTKSPSTDTFLNGQATTSTTGATNGTTNNNQIPPGPGIIPAQESRLTDAQIKQLINFSTIRIPETGIDARLSNGAASYTNGATKGTVQIGDVIAKVFTDRGYDAFVDLTVRKENSPTVTHYLALFNVQGSTVKFTSSKSFGDRISITRAIPLTNDGVQITTDQSDYIKTSIGYSLTVYYLDHANGQAPTANPTVKKDTTVQVKNQIII